MPTNRSLCAFGIAALLTTTAGIIGEAHASYNLKPPRPSICQSTTIGQMVTTSYVLAPYAYYEKYKCVAPFTWEWVGWSRCYTSTGQCQVLQLP